MPASRWAIRSASWRVDDSCLSFRIDSRKDLDPLSGEIFVRWQPPNGDKKVSAVSPASRSLRGASREPEAVIPALIIPVFFFAVNVGSLQKIAEAAGGFDYMAFQLPVAVIFAVTGVSRANALVGDIASGYFERLLLTPVSRLALLLGLMVADFVLVVALCLPVLLLGAIVGVKFTTGLAGVIAFVLLSGAWGVAFTGFPYTIALRTGNPGAVAAASNALYSREFLSGL